MSITHARPAIALDAAWRLVTAAIEAATTRRLAVAVAVCDHAGTLVAFARMDGATPPICGFAIDKAFTAATMVATTREFGERMTRDPLRAAGLCNRERLLAWPGGLPILFAGKLIGAIGVSGASDEEDEEIGALALNALPD